MIRLFPAVLMLCLPAVALGPAADVNALFTQERATMFGEAEGLPPGACVGIALDDKGNPLAAYAVGSIYIKDAANGWSRWGQTDHAIEGMTRLESGVWVWGGGSLTQMNTLGEMAVSYPAVGEVNAVADWKGGLLVGTDAGATWLKENDPPKQIAMGQPVHAIATTPSIAIIGTQANLFQMEDSFTVVPLYPVDDRYSWAPRNVAAAVALNGGLWFASSNGVGSLNGDMWTLYTGDEGLPYDHFTCAAAGGGLVWFGTERGAIWFDGKEWGYRANKRWLPDDHVNGVAVTSNGSAWIATNTGVSFIERFPMTLAEKADHFEKVIDDRHVRMGYVVRCYFDEPGAIDTAWMRHTDNDGLYTAMYGASQCFRYGATKDPEAKARAKRCLDAMEFLFTATGIPGFPARSVIPIDWPEDPNENFGEAANLAEQKVDPLWKNIVPRWPKSADGKYYWKCDTSSDEIAGHYFFYAAYYDLVAETPEEKKQVVDIVDALSSHIVDNNFCLIDHDGKPTRWAQWSPEYCNAVPGGYADRGLQAVEILSFLNVAYHCTGKQKYLDAAKYLRDEHDYHIHAIGGRNMFPPEYVVPWDTNLAFLSYYGLLKYEQDPALLKLYRMSLDRNWLFIKRQNDPFFNFMTAAVFPDKDKPAIENYYIDFDDVIAKAVPTLQSTPYYLIGWEMNNSHRLDVQLDPTPRAREGYGWSRVTQEAIPIAERSHIRINSDHFDLDKNMGDGRVEYESTYYLLPYYMGLYFGYLK